MSYTPSPQPGNAASTADDRGRAEYPPAQYWRRWVADAPAANAPIPDTDAAPASMTTPAPTPSTVEDDAYRVLVVEDDPTQALFAEGVLRGAGIRAQGARVAEEVMPAMETFQPDLVLMDLHMPGMSGTELTALIRGHEAFAHTPIVFLTGDPDPERQFEALESGADDFLSKPIRPRHLIAAVHSRIKRARSLAGQRNDAAKRHPDTSLYHRPHVLRALATALAAGSQGSALFVEIRNATLLRDRYGYAGFEQLINQAGQRVAALAGDCPCARLNDNAFLVFAAGLGDTATQSLARILRAGIRQPPFEQAGMPQHLDAAVGYTALTDFADAGALLDGLEQAARAARGVPTGTAIYVPSAAGVETARGLAATIRSALQSGALELAFQPVVAVAGGEDAQFQVLLRMRDATGTLHRAGTLIPAAETAGLMPDVDRWVAEQAIGLMRRRRDEHRAIRLFVSQSPLTLARDLHAEWLREMLASHELEGTSLVIDLRLDDALLHTVTLRHFCDLLMPAGVQFCLSQYTQGPEADALLEQLPLGYVRLSPRYSDAHTNTALRDELRGIIDRAHRIGLQVIGPQVENAQSAAMLWMSGIDLIQGNLVQQADEELDFDFQHAVL